MNDQAEVICRTLRTTTQLITANARVVDEYIYFALKYMTDNIFFILPIKHLVNKYSEPTMPHKLTTGKKISVPNSRVLFGPCVVQKSTTHVDTVALNMCHQLQNGLWDIFVVITQHKKGYLI